MIKYNVLSSNDPMWESAAKQIGSVDWHGGEYLAGRMMNDTWQPWEKVVYATSDGEMAGFCALLEEDIVPNTPYKPFVSAVFVNSDFRGQGVSMNLVKTAERVALEAKVNKLFIVTRHIGLYEHLKYEQIDEKDNRFGIPNRILAKTL